MRNKTTSILTGMFESSCHTDPQFAGAAIIPSSQKFKEEIYFFFSELNKTARVDEEPYRARIGRICTVKNKQTNKPEKSHSCVCVCGVVAVWLNPGVCMSLEG